MIRIITISTVVSMCLVAGLQRKMMRVPVLRPIARQYSPYTPQIIPAMNVREMTMTYSLEDDGKSIYGFDSSGGFVDPLNGITDFPDPGGVRHMFPTKIQYNHYFADKSIGYLGAQGVELLVDLTGAADLSDTTHTVSLTDIYGASSTFDAGDSLYVYDFTPYFRAPITNRWAYLARPDSLMTPLGYLVTQGGGFMRWQSLSVSVSTRYILLRINRRDRGGYQTLPDYSKLIFYGNYNYSVPALAKMAGPYTGALPTRPYGQFVGTNLGQGIDTLQTQYDGDIRVYWSKDYMDKYATRNLDSLHEPGFTDIGIGQYPSYLRHGQTCYQVITGSSSYFQSLMGPNTWFDMDTLGLDPRSPYSYSRCGTFWFNYAAFYGSVAIDTAYTIWRPKTRNGNGYMKGAEDFNEWDSRSITIQSYFAKACVDYDGWEGRVGMPGRTGKNSADPSFRLRMGATMLRDTNAVSVLVFLSKTQRIDGHLPFDDITYHQYSRSKDYLHRSASSAEQVGEHGESPEVDSVLYFDQQYVRVVYGYIGGDTSMHIFKTEYGYGNGGTTASTEAQAASPWDVGCLPTAGGWDSLTLKAILMARSELIMCGSGLYGYDEYMFHNSDFGANTFLLFQPYGRTTGRDIHTFQSTTLFAWFYYRACLYNRLKNYKRQFAFISNGGVSGEWIERWTNISHPDSVCIVHWLATYNGSHMSSHTLTLPNIKSSNVIEVLPSFTSLTDTATTLSVSNGTVSRYVDERPSMYFFQDNSLTTTINPIQTIYRNRRINHKS